MSILFATSLLRFFHLVHTLAIFADSYWKRLIRAPPKALTAERRRIPKHLALLLFSDVDSDLTTTKETLLQNSVKVVTWCRAVGIEKLTVYDECGILLKCTKQIRERVMYDHNSPSIDSSESEMEYLVTSPPSDYSESWPISRQDTSANVVPTITMHFPPKPTPRKPSNILRNVMKTQCSDHKRDDNCTHQKPLTLCLISRESAKPAIASAACSIVTLQSRLMHANVQNIASFEQFTLSVDALASLLEDESGLSPPDLMIVQPITSPLQAFELHGFPPWHIRLTEIYYGKYLAHQGKFNSLFKRCVDTQSLDEIGFREALDEFAQAEMRFGK